MSSKQSNDPTENNKPKSGSNSKVQLIRLEYNINVLLEHYPGSPNNRAIVSHTNIPRYSQTEQYFFQEVINSLGVVASAHNKKNYLVLIGHHPRYTLHQHLIAVLTPPRASLLLPLLIYPPNTSLCILLNIQIAVANTTAEFAHQLVQHSLSNTFTPQSALPNNLIAQSLISNTNNTNINTSDPTDSNNK